MTQQSFRSQWLWVILVSAGVCLITSLPYIAGWLAQTPDLHYALVAVQVEDTLSYFSKMLQGRQGLWLFHLTYTSQLSSSAPIFIYYLFIGHLSYWFGLSIPLTFHLARVVQGFFLLVSAYAFIRHLTEIEKERRFIFLLVCLSSGVAGIPESNTFYTLMDNPHFVLSQTLLLLLAALYLCPSPSSEKKRWAELTLFAVMSAMLATLQPHMTATLLAIGAIYSVLQWWRDRKVPTYLIARLLVCAVVGIFVVGVTYYYLYSDPVLRVWQDQTTTLSPPMWVYLIGYGLLLVPAISGAIWAIRNKTSIGSLLIIWCLVSFVSVYAPIAVQRRLISGVHLPLAFLAGLGICRVWVARWKLGQRWAWAYQVCTWAMSGLLVVNLTVDVVNHDSGLYMTVAEDQALSWLSDQAPPNSVVLASPALGRFVPAFTPHRVVFGHWPETINASTIEPMVEHFYSDAATRVERCVDLAQWGVNYVIVGPRERDLGVAANWSAEKSSLERVAGFGNVEVDQVQCR